MDGERSIRLTVGEINALTKRGVWSRLGFSIFVAAIACTIAPWAVVAPWLFAVFVWEFVIRRAFERWTLPAAADDRSEQSLYKLAAVHAFGASIYATMAAIGFLSKTPTGEQLAMGWIAGAAIHSFVYFSNRRALLIANLAAPLLVALTAPTLASAGFTWPSVLSTILTLTLVASAATFATDRNALLTHLSHQINARRAAEAAAAAKSQFLKTISHELRTPLNAVIGYAELLEENLGDSGEHIHRADAAQISVAGRRLLLLINDILQVARQEANAPLLQLDQIDLDALLNDLQATALELCKGRANRFSLAAAPIPTLVLDEAKLKDCLLKLIANAAKFTQAGEVTLRVWCDDDRALFEVADTGIGIAPDALPSIFDPFVQSDGSTTRAYEGAGLGLAVARKNARLMRGDITVESKLGAGSVFTLWVPIPETEKHSRRDGHGARTGGDGDGQ